MKSSQPPSPALLVCRTVLGFSWIYQGVVPKIVCRTKGETDLLAPLAQMYRITCDLVVLMGIGEVVFGLALLAFGTTLLYRLNIIALLLLVGWVAAVEPGLLVEPFNPVTLSAALAGLSLVALYESKKTAP